MAAKKRSLNEFETGDLRKAYTGILLLKSSGQEAVDALSMLKAELTSRQREIIVSMSKEEVSNQWVSRRPALPEKLDNLLAEMIPEWNATGEARHAAAEQSDESE